MPREITHPPRHAGAHLHHFLHHLRVALVVGAAVSILHGWGLLKWLDALMLSAAGPSGSLHAPADPSATTPPTPPGLPWVLLIDPATYELGFRQSSPLDRQKLAQLIGQVPARSEQGPRTVAIDLDLSPVPGDTAAQAALDAQLARLVRGQTQLVLAHPAGTQRLHELKATWMSALCEHNGKPGAGRLTFASPAVLTHFGQVLQYDPQARTLGVVAHQPELQTAPCATPAALLSALADGLPADAKGVAPLRPFNAKLFLQIERQIVLTQADGGLVRADGAPTPPAWAGAALFIGGAYDARDRFRVPVAIGGERSTEGVIVHAAAYYTQQHPLRESQWLAFALDIVAGVLMGYLFHATWGLARHAVGRASQRGPWAEALAQRVGLLGNVLALAVALYVCLSLAYTYAYPMNWWVNPGPVILGVFCKFLIGSGAGRLSEAPHGDAGHGPARSAEGLAWAEAAVLTAVALYLIATH